MQTKQPVRHSKAERVPAYGPSALSFRGHPGLPLPVASRALVIMERGTAYEVGAPLFEKLPFLESSYFLFPQIGSPAHITLSAQALEPEARKVSAGKGHVVSLTCSP